MALRAAVSRIPAASRLPALGRLPFSTSSGNSIGDIIENDIASYSNATLVAAVSNGFPFKVEAPLGSNAYHLERKYRNERISVRAPSATVNPDNGDDPFLPVTVRVHKGGFEVMSLMNVKPDQVHIQKVAMRNRDTDMKDYKEYLRSRGITPKAISFMYDCLGLSQKKA